MLWTQTETALYQRLSAGLGQMAQVIRHYPGQLTLSSELLASLPAVWIAFEGITQTEPYSSSRQQYKATAQFAVLVGAPCTDTADAVNPYTLIYAVRRLLSGQDFGLSISPLSPAKVRPVLQQTMDGQVASILACEFTTSWVEHLLARQHWPCPETANEPDAVFAKHLGRLDSPAPDWLHTDLQYHLAPDDGYADAQDRLSHPPRSTP